MSARTHYRIAHGDICVGFTISPTSYEHRVHAEAALRSDDIGIVIPVDRPDHPGAVHDPRYHYFVAAGNLGLGVRWYGPFGNPDEAERYGQRLGVEFQVLGEHA